MKKTLAILLTILLSLTALPAMAENAGNELFAVLITGGWEVCPAEAQALPEAAQAAFEKATEGLVGAVYTPVALLSTQVVAGINYCILCQITPVVPDAAPTWNLVYIYADLEGSAAITNVYEIFVDRHAEPKE